MPNTATAVPATVPYDHRRLFSRKEAAAMLSVSERSITYLIEQGRLRVTRIGRRTLISKDAIEMFAGKDQPQRIYEAA